VKLKTRAGRGWLAAGIGTVLAAVAVIIWVTWPQPAPGPHARVYLNVTACLLTGPSGIAPGTTGAPAWAAMQGASKSTRVMVSYLPAVTRSDTTAMLNTLIERRCGVIITADTPAAQVLKAARANPRQHFLLITAPGRGAGAAPGNATVVPATAAAGRITQAIRALAAAA
jgi:hypothetical protein